MRVLITPTTNPIRAEITVPADKSIAHRALILSAIAKGRSHISALPSGADVQTTLSILKKCGIKIEPDDKKGFWITGQGGAFNLSGVDQLDCQNSGTTARLLTGLFAGMQIPVTLLGDDSLSKRPMKRVIDPLQQMGANIICRDQDFLPIQILKSIPLKGLQYELPVASAQVKSALLLAGLFADSETQITELIPTRDHTELLLKQFGAELLGDGLTTRLQPSILQATNIEIPGDISSAMFFITLATIVPGSDLIVHNVGLNLTRLGGIRLLQRMGADIQIDPSPRSNQEVKGTVRVRYQKLRGIDIAPSEVPYAVDEIPIILIAAALAEGQTVLKGAQELRKKESDRLAGMSDNLKAFGVQVDPLEDGLVVHGKAQLRGAECASFGDHRIAMACCVAAAVAESPSTIADWRAVDVSFPEFDEIAAKSGISLQVK